MGLHRWLGFRAAAAAAAGGVERSVHGGTARASSKAQPGTTSSVLARAACATHCCHLYLSGCSTQEPEVPPKGFRAVLAKTEHALGTAWEYTSYVLNCDWLNLGRWPSFVLFWLIIIGLPILVGCTANSVKNNVKLGVEFGGGYQMR